MMRMMKREKYLLTFVILTAVGWTTSFVNGLKFTVEPTDTIVPKGGSVVLDCAARGDGNVKISWKKDRNHLQLDNDHRRSILSNGSLYINSLLQTRESKVDEGLYQCVSTIGGIGAILSRSAKLQAAFLSRFDEEPEDISIGIGQTARFGCSAQGIPPPTVSWFKDDRPLELDSSRMTVLPSGSLEVSEIQPSDEGIYRCNISNVDKSAMSRSGRLVLNNSPVRDTPPVFTAVPKSQTVVSPNSVVLECSAVAYPQPKITWLKDGATIDLGNLDSRYELIGEGNLMITRTEESDRGTYQCRAENREDSADVSAVLDVYVTPRVLSTAITNFYAYEKEDVELPCKMYGKPTPTIEWFKNAQMIIEGDYFQIVNGNNLKILGLVASDAGMYQCVGTNPAGNVQAAVHLRVLKPGEIKPIEEIDENDEPEIPEPLPLKPLLGQIMPTPRGGNRHGGFENHTASPDGPSPPREVAAVLVSTRFVTLTWKPPSDPNGRIVAYAIFYKELGSDRERVLNTSRSRLEEVNVQGLQPNKRYTFRVVPYNDKGAGVSSEEITVLTQPEVDVPGPPRGMRAWSTSPSSIHVRWDPPEETHGSIARYKVSYVEATNGNEPPPPATTTEETIDDSELDEYDDEDYFLPSKSDKTRTVTVTSADAVIHGLNIYTEYFIWVVAVNENGPGANSEQLKVRTLGAEPDEPPRNVTLESSSATSIAVRWEPPPVEARNGIITGYKLKYKQKGKKRAETVTSDGNTRFFALNNLDRGVEYQVKMAAINVNGTGPWTDWMSVATFQRDLDESQVPDKPGTMPARANAESITVSWAPPRNTNIMVRGYTIGWGKGIPDVYTKVLDGKRRSFTIDKLKPNSDYVISLRAYNQMGDGEPVYYNLRTRETSEEDDEEGPSMAQLPPPVGLRAIVLSPSSVVLYWTDTSLPKHQVVSDNRYYVVRYLPTEALSLGQKRSQVKHVNTTELNTILDDLRPGTQFEFSVKVVRGRHASEWSLVAYNTTFEATPHSPPQDLTLLAITGENGQSSVILNWQPPRMTKEEEMKGYMVFYTTNPSLKEWVEDPIPDDVLTHKVPGLTPDTTYFFRMAARHSKGLGPYTDTKSITTPASKRSYGMGYDRNRGKYDPQDKAVAETPIVLFILIGLSVAFALASVILCIYYRKRGSEPSGSPKQTSLKKQRKPELKPPDLWIHHDQMELKNLDKEAQQLETPLSPQSRGSREIGDPEEKMPLHHHTTNSLDKRNFMSSYLETDNSQIQSIQCHSLGRTRKPKAIKIPVEPFFFKNDVGGGGTADLRSNPIFSRNSQSQFRAGQTTDSASGQNSTGADAQKTYDSVPSGSSTASSQQNLNSLAQYGATSDYGTQSAGSSIGTLNRRTGGNLKSFAVPVPPNTATLPHHPTTPQQKHNPVSRPVASGVVGITPNPNNTHGGLQSSPIKRISTQFAYPQQPSLSPQLNYPPSEDGSNLQKCYSTEELSQEISNLEGLMQDLNAITASEFQC